jgi:hypothetical protein
LCEKIYFYFSVFKNLGNFLTSLSQYVKVAHFVLWCWGSVCRFCFCGGGFSIGFVLWLIVNAYFLILCKGVIVNKVAFKTEVNVRKLNDKLLQMRSRAFVF